MGILVDHGNIHRRITHVLCPVIHGWPAVNADTLLQYAVMMGKAPDVTITVVRIVPNAPADDVEQTNKLTGTFENRVLNSSNNFN